MIPAMRDGRQADTDRRRERVATAVKNAAKTGEPISVSGIARQARVDRTFLYRHRDLLDLVHAAELQPSGQDVGQAVSRASLQADLAHARDRNTRLTARLQQLERRLAEALGEQAWQESGLGAPVSIDQLQREITRLEQKNIELTGQVEETQADLQAARETNRDSPGPLYSAH